MLIGDHYVYHSWNHPLLHHSGITFNVYIPHTIADLLSSWNLPQWNPWWRHQMETFSASLARCEGNSPAIGEFPSQRPVTRSFDVFFDLNKRSSKPSTSWWFEMTSRSLLRHSNAKPNDSVWISSASDHDWFVKGCSNIVQIWFRLQQSQNAPVPYTTMHHFVTEMCTGVHISVTQRCIVGYWSYSFWDLWDGSNVSTSSFWIWNPCEIVNCFLKLQLRQRSAHS